MILFLSNGKQIRGDLIKSAVLRSDMAPVPLTLEAEIRIDDGMADLLAEGQVILAGGDQTALTIIKSEASSARVAQGDKAIAYIQIVALLEAVRPVAFVRRAAIVKENSTLSAIYRAAGARLATIVSDFNVPRFYCTIGDTPTYQIARCLQEEGGIVRWRAGKLQFFRLPDLFKQKAVTDVPNNETANVASGFLERHTVPWFFSVDASGAVIHGNREKARSARYAPFRNVQQLRNMSRCLVHRRIVKMDFNISLCAGDIVSVMGSTDSLVIVTAAHVYESGTEGSTPGQYTRLWLSTLEG